MLNINKIKYEIEEKNKELEKVQEQINYLKNKINNINKYESIIICNPNIKAQDVLKLKEKIKEKIENDFKTLEIMGNKKLAYEIQKQKEGFYISMKFETFSNNIADLERYYRINDNILKFIVIKCEY